MAMGIKVSKPGYSVASAASEDLYVDTTIPILKVQSQGSGSITFVSGDGIGTERTATVTHSLNYLPIVQVYAERNQSANRRIVLGSGFSGFGTINVEVRCEITTTKIDIVFRSLVGTPDGTYNYYYYIFHDSATS